MSGATKACCQYVQVAQFDSKPFNSNYAARIPPIVPKGYQAKGEYKTINGLKTCKCYQLLKRVIITMLIYNKYRRHRPRVCLQGYRRRLR